MTPIVLNIERQLECRVIENMRALCRTGRPRTSRNCLSYSHTTLTQNSDLHFFAADVGMIRICEKCNLQSRI